MLSICVFVIMGNKVFTYLLTYLLIHISMEELTAGLVLIVHLISDNNIALKFIFDFQELLRVVPICVGIAMACCLVPCSPACSPW